MELSQPYVEPIIENVQTNIIYNIDRRQIICESLVPVPKVSIQFIIDNKDRKKKIQENVNIIAIYLKLVGIKQCYARSLNKYKIVIVDNFGNVFKTFFYGDLYTIISPFFFFKNKYNGLLPLSNKIIKYIQNNFNFKEIKDMTIDSQWYNELYGLNNNDFYFSDIKEKYHNLKYTYNKLRNKYNELSSKNLILQNKNNDLTLILNKVINITSFITNQDQYNNKMNELEKKRTINELIKKANEYGLNITNNINEENGTIYNYYNELANKCIDQINMIIEKLL